eukprot:UN16786
MSQVIVIGVGLLVCQLLTPFWSKADAWLLLTNLPFAEETPQRLLLV